MPKITIKEYDKTKAGRREYANFAVVVPGFVAEGTSKETGKAYGLDKEGESVFDDNGVYECDSQADFINYIGCTSAGNIRVAARAASFTSEPIKYTGSNEFTAAFKTAAANMYVLSSNTTGVVGYCKDAKYVYTNVAELHKSVGGFTWDADKQFVIYDATKDSLGADAVEGGQYGNQIAYELLGLGYTILFKKIKSAADLTAKAF